MKVIDLLNKIAKGEEVPEKIKYDKIDYSWCDLCKIYERIEDYAKDLYNDIDSLNDEVEIIEEDKKIEELLVLKDLENHSILNNKEKAKIFDDIYYTNLCVIQKKINEVNKLKDDNK